MSHAGSELGYEIPNSIDVMADFFDFVAKFLRICPQREGKVVATQLFPVS